MLIKCRNWTYYKGDINQYNMGIEKIRLSTFFWIVSMILLFSLHNSIVDMQIHVINQFKLVDTEPKQKDLECLCKAQKKPWFTTLEKSGLDKEIIEQLFLRIF